MAPQPMEVHREGCPVIAKSLHITKTKHILIGVSELETYCN